MEVSYSKILSNAVKEHLPNASHGTVASKLDHSSCVIASTYTSTYEYLHRNDYECGDRSRLLVVLRWCSVMLHKFMDKYVSSPFLLAIGPLLLGVVLGTGIAFHYLNANANANERIKSRQGFSLGSVLYFLKGVLAVFRSELEAGVSIFAQVVEEESDNSSHGHGLNDEGIAVKELCNDQNTGSIEDEGERDCQTRKYLRSDLNTERESGVDISMVPNHIAVIMDGNRRYGRSKYGSITRGHWDGSKTLVDFSKWCLAEGIKVVTVYAFSTENWNRGASEVSALMNIFCKYCDELRVEAVENGIRLQVLSTETDQIPADVANGMQKMVEETKHCDKLVLNICLSYGSRGEILNACRAVAKDVDDGTIAPNDIDEGVFKSKLLTGNCADPDLIIRTSGEYRLSNFLLWQLAYSEMFFLNKQWPELTKSDLLSVIRQYATGRKRRYGR